MRKALPVLKKDRPGPATAFGLTLIRAAPDGADPLSSIARMAKGH